MLNYIVVFFTVVVINVVPLLMPPTWIVLAFFREKFIFDPFFLALVGAAGSTIGRLLLTYLGTLSRRFIGRKRISNLDFIGKAVKKNPDKSFFVTFLFALSPFPSNVYFATLGLAKSRTVSVFAGFFTGRVISYYILILSAHIILQRFEDIFTGRLTQIVVIDAVAVISMIIFIMIDWESLVVRKRLKLIPLKILRK